MEESKIKEAVEEIKSAGEDEIKTTIEKWFEKTKTQSMRLGAYYISAGVYGIIKKHLGKKAKSSLRDYQRMTDEIIEIVSVQLATEETVQNDYYVEEASNDE